MFGKVSWRVTICLPPEDRRCIRTSSKDARLKEEYQYRNSCYKTAFLYLQAMGKDKNCQVNFAGAAAFKLLFYENKIFLGKVLAGCFVVCFFLF